MSWVTGSIILFTCQPRETSHRCEKLKGRNSELSFFKQVAGIHCVRLIFRYFDIWSRIQDLPQGPEMNEESIETRPLWAIVTIIFLHLLSLSHTHSFAIVQVKHTNNTPFSDCHVFNHHGYDKARWVFSSPKINTLPPIHWWITISCLHCSVDPLLIYLSFQHRAQLLRLRK